MIDQVLIAKRLFSIGSTYSEQTDPLSAGLAISLFQDSVELLVWCIAKHHSVGVKDNEAFTSLLEKIEKISPDGVPYKAKILELNKARAGFKHYGNLPASSESTKFRSYTQDFLMISCQRFLNINFDEVSLSSIIQIQKVREHAQNAEKKLAEGNASEALSEVAHARFFLFEELEKHLPKVDSSLRDADRLFEQLSSGRSVQVFHYLTEYLTAMTRFNVAALAGGDIGQHLYFERALPHVMKFMGGNTKLYGSQWVEPTPEFVEKAIKYVVETAIRLANVS